MTDDPGSEQRRSTAGSGEVTDRLSGYIRFDPESGLVPAVVQSAADGRVLMLGYMNRAALARTLDDGRVTFFSRSRGRLWRKGQTSGHWLEALRVEVDCDGDALLVRARARGPTCHTGRRSCFDAGPFAALGGDASGSTSLGAMLESLEEVIADRDRSRPRHSHTAELLEGGTRAIARKVGEEALEVLLAALAPESRDLADPERLAGESADLLYHLLVLWRAAGLEGRMVAGELNRRRARGRGEGR